jgi:aspartate beta-hydroxylase
MREVLAEGFSLQPFLQTDFPEALGGYLQTSFHQTPVWDASSIARVSAGTSTAAVARMNRRCSSRSRLSAAAIAHPKSFIRFCDQAHILSRTGVINTRLVTHLTLIVPKDCALRVVARRMYGRGSQRHIRRHA